MRNNTNAEIEVQESLLYLSEFLKKSEDGDRAISSLIQVTLYINNIERTNMELLMASNVSKGKIYNQINNLLKQCLKN